MKNSYPELETKITQRIDALALELSSIRAGRASAAVLEKVCAHGNKVQPTLNIAETGFFRRFNELVNPGDKALPGSVGDQNLAAHLEHRAFACGTSFNLVLHITL